MDNLWRTYWRLGLPLFILAMLLLPATLNPTYLTIACTFLIFSVVALSQDIILGKAGMFNMGQILFFGVGAYTTAILNFHFAIPVLYTIPVAIVIAAVIGVLAAAPIVHLRGDYLLVVTVGLNIVFVQTVQNDLGELTGGPNGIFGIASLTLFGWDLSSQTAIYYVALVVLVFTLWLMHNLENSKAGRALHYLREDQIAAESMGINARTYKVFAFGLGAGIAGLAGAIYAIQFSAVSPDAFQFRDSVLFFSIIIVGGSSIPGVLMGVFIMFVLPQIFTEFATWRYFVFGLAMMLTMILRPRGFWPAKFGRIPAYLQAQRNKS